MLGTRRTAMMPALLLTGFCAALLFYTTPAARAQQTEVPARPQGPAAGPIIKLPRGTQAEAERRPQTESLDAQTAAPIAAARKWEYCAITGFVWKQQGFSLSSPKRPAAVVRYFSGGSDEVEGADEEMALANAFARLGDEGWELTTVRTSIHLEDGDGHTTHVYYFKRPRSVD
jgi:hypothetical protein